MAVLCLSELLILFKAVESAYDRNQPPRVSSPLQLLDVLPHSNIGVYFIDFNIAFLMVCFLILELLFVASSILGLLEKQIEEFPGPQQNYLCVCSMHILDGAEVICMTTRFWNKGSSWKPQNHWEDGSLQYLCMQMGLFSHSGPQQSCLQTEY